MNDFNFFSAYSEVKKGANIKYTYVIAAAAVIVASLAVFYLVTANRINSLNRELKEMDDFLASGDTLKQSADYNDRKRKLEVMNKYYESVEGISSAILSADCAGSEIINKITASMPKDVFFQNITMESGSIQLQGVSRGRTPVAEFQHNLNTLGAFESVYISSIAQEAEDSSNYRFTMKCTLKDVSQNEAN